MKGPDLFADHQYRPYVCLSDESHPFGDEEALYAAATTTPRDTAVLLEEPDFRTGGLPRETDVNPWTVVSIRHADVRGREGRLVESTTDRIATATAGYLGVG